mmetsp:Transcript_2492/g.3863  ORF Transcript_2492/g.3863 Transcript_2492/m.3863 type:complete len:244 (-) Transcript_2492:38-769(-)
MSYILFCVSTDGTTEDPRRKYQVYEMYNLLCGASDAVCPTGEGFESARDFNPRCSDDSDTLDVCQWIGVTCHRGIIDSIAWSSHVRQCVSLRWLNPQWIPSNASRVSICHQQSKSVQPFSTRHLPKSLFYLDMRSSHLHGGLDVRSLPEKMHQLHVPSNFLAGAIDLRGLPGNFRVLDVQENLIHLVVLDNLILPKALESVRVSSRSDTRRDIAVHEISGAYLDYRICIEKWDHRTDTRTRID